MHNGNPHPPSTSWLDSVAHPNGGYNEAEPGQQGTDIVERDGKRFEVTVRRMPEEEPPRKPILRWVKANRHRFVVPDGVTDEEIADEIVAAIKEAGSDGGA